jgi:hypothetical protein
MSQTTAWEPASYAQHGRFVADLGEPLLHLLDPKPGELILDLGCGDGALTEKMDGGLCAAQICRDKECVRSRNLIGAVRSGLAGHDPLCRSRGVLSTAYR